MSKRTLNYWLLHKPPGWEFVGFIEIDGYWGLQVGHTCVAPLFIFKPKEVWGDSDKTSAKLPWVLFAKGNDDTSYYMLCGSKESAMKYAKQLIDDNEPLDVYVDTYNGRKWQNQ